MQATVLLAPVTPDDSDQLARKKMKIVATYLVL